MTAADIVGGAGTEDFPGPTDPLRVAKAVRAEWRAAGLHLLHYAGTFWRWLGPHWEQLDDEHVEKWLYQRVEDEKYVAVDKNGVATPRPWQPTEAKIKNVRHAMARLLLINAGTEPPVWLGDGRPPWSGPVIACANGLLELNTRVLHEHTPAWFNQVSTPFAYDPAAPTPTKWLRFLADLWPEDPTAIAALKMWLGYVISGRTDLHRILLLVGPPRSGKGTIARVQEALVGRGHVANPTLSSLAQNFGLQPLLGKSLAVVGDARLSGKTDGGPVVERLLTISGEDAITVDRKHLRAWTGHLPVRFAILSNELPRLGDASGAIASRFLTLILQTSHIGREDTTLGPALQAELPGIFGWVLAGLDELTARGAFVEPQSSIEAVAALAELTSPTKAFLNECTTAGGEVFVSYLFEAWSQWCVTNGHPSGSVHTFARNLRAAVPALGVVQRRTPDGSRQRAFVGLQVTPAAAPRSRLPWGPS